MSLILNGKIPWVVRGRKEDTLEERVSVKSQKQGKEEVRELGKGLSSLQRRTPIL